MAEQSAGLMESLKRLVSTLASIVSTRLELLANELQEERLHLTRMVVYALIALFCFGMSILLLTGFIVVLFWDDHRVAALGGLGAVFLVLAILMTILLRNKAHARPRLFSASLAELAKDRAQLDSHHE
jgi:uncharacterized membrane protein YqjE